MRIVFLDIDGVLNYTKWYADDRNPGNLYGREGDIDPLCAERVMRICNLAGAKVVVSSDWRMNWEGTRKRLKRMGLDENYVVDKTPEFIWSRPDGDDFINELKNDVYEYTRGAEIDEWLKRNSAERYVIVDDRTDFTEEQKRSFVHVNPYEGLTDKDVELAIKILRNEI